MREIKFRVFNTKEKKMFTHFKGARIDYALEYWETHKHVSEPMQFTGLKDKNGKEIYEGDIILVEEDYGEWISLTIPEKIEWISPTFWRITLDEEMPEHAKAKYLSDYKEIYEVIGNIYENPEILSNSSPPVRTSDKKSDFDKSKEFNTDYVASPKFHFSAKRGEKQ